MRESNIQSLPKVWEMSLPKSWEKKGFGDCIEKVVYTKKIKRKEFLSEGEYPIISQEQEFINGYWNNSDDLFKIKKPVVIFGDHTRIVKFVDFNFVLGADGVKILQTKNGIEPRFFYYFLKSVDLGDLGYARHFRLLKEIQIPIPPLPEQKRIVAILDRAFEAIDEAKANAKQNLKKAKELFESYLNRVFEEKGNDWEEMSFYDIVDYSKKVKGLILDSPIPFIPMNNIPLNEKYIEVNEYREKVTSGTFVKKGDLLLAKITPSFENGKQGIVNIQEEYAYATTEVIPFQGKKEVIETLYLFYFLKSKIRKTLESKMEGATGRQRLPQKVLNEILVPFPKSIETQKQIVQKLDALQAETKKLEKIYQQKIDNLEELKKSVLQKAFAGELTVDS